VLCPLLKLTNQRAHCLTVIHFARVLFLVYLFMRLYSLFHIYSSSASTHFEQSAPPNLRTGGLIMSSSETSTISSNTLTETPSRGSGFCQLDWYALNAQTQPASNAQPQREVDPAEYVWTRREICKLHHSFSLMEKHHLVDEVRVACFKRSLPSSLTTYLSIESRKCDTSHLCASLHAW
jgi:hypothetical protein